MKIEMNGETYVKGIQEFYETATYVNVKKMKNRAILLIVLGILFVVIGIIDKDMGKLMIISGCIVIACSLFSAFAPKLSERSIKKIVKNNNVLKEECIIENNLLVKTTLKGEIENKAEYEFKDIIKIKESENFYFIYISKYSVVFVAKNSIGDINDFIAKFRENNVLIENERSY